MSVIINGQPYDAIGKVTFISRGTYSSSATYNHLDWVRYNGKSWVCKQDNITNVTPVEGSTWTVLASDGEPDAFTTAQVNALKALL